MPKVIIFDFDGTIADSLDVGIAVFNGMSQKLGTEKVGKKEVREILKMPPMKIVEKFHISKWKIPWLLKEARKRMNAEIGKVKPFPEMRPTLNKLSKSGCMLGMLTSNSQENVEKFIKNHKVDCLSFIYCGSGIFGKDKMLRKIIKKYDFDTSDIIYVGDEIRDIEAARKVGIKIASVSWGFCHKRLLLKHKPDYMIERPRELLKLVKK